MPCYDPRPPIEYENGVRYGLRKSEETAAYLCGVLTLIEKKGLLDQFLNEIDYGELMSGAKANKDTLGAWWRLHKMEDERRRKREKDEAARELLIKQGLAKLSEEEIEALGLNARWE